MRGVNLGGWFSQIDAIQEKDPESFVDSETHIRSFLSRADFQRIKQWGFDHARLPVDYFNVFDGAELRPLERILKLLDRAIDDLAAADLNVILDLHKCPGHDFHAGSGRAQEFFSNPERRVQSKQVWKHLAERYRSYAKVSFEILNEPVAEDAADWDAVKDEMAAHIRHYAPHSTIVIGSNRWNSPGEFARLTPVRDDNVLYSFHFYSSILFTHQRAPWVAGDIFRERRAYPGTYAVPVDTSHRLPLALGQWDRQRMLSELEPVLQFRDRHAVDVGCHEFGVFVGGPDRSSQLRWMRDFVSILEELGFGFSYWNYKNLDFGLVSQGERAYAGYPQYDNADRTDTELVSILTGRQIALPSMDSMHRRDAARE